ncbi:hypothetical protein [Nocardia blacklockiae]|uniref:hypothetical protein n=1 Tax=Nocardia blacklockiae TaxID=480036 RepID=UPI001892F805|nr:hypothetical protein [Nocardia blacklockiae]MBF6172341.1 hypothetical protein [Nocardia blacklockiae]
MKRAIVSTVATVALLAGGAALTAGTAAADTTTPPAAGTGSASTVSSLIQTLLAGKAGCGLLSMSGGKPAGCA